MKRRKYREYDDEDLKAYIKLPVRKKLTMIEEMNDFFDRFMPRKSKKIWEELKRRGF